jgi:proline iminopeptidase
MNASESRAAPRELWVELGAAKLFVRELGRGRPIVVLHGGPDFDHQYLLPELDRLAEFCRLIYYAQCGRGASAGTVRPDSISLASEMADLDALREHLELDSVGLLGHSWGGLLAMEYAIRHPHRVSRLILMNTGPASHADYLTLRDSRRRSAPEVLESMAEIAATPRFQAGDLEIEADYYRLHYGSTLRDPRQLERLLPRLRANFTPASTLRARQIEDRLMNETWSLPRYDLIPALRSLSIPTLVIHGAHDLVPEEVTRRIADAIDGARFERIENSGHFSYLDAPEALERTVRAFLA